jgi:membrane protease YdiL (CAAX protease family)
MATYLSTRNDGPPGGIPLPVGVSVVVSYLLLHAVWAQLVRGPYTFVVERVIFLILTVALLTIPLRLPLHQTIGHFRLPGRKDLRFYLLIIAAIVFCRMLMKGASEAISPGTDMASLTLRRFVDECVIPPLDEEPVFRGLIFLSLVPVFAPRRWPAVAFSAAVFASAHSARDLRAMIATPILGTLLAIAFLRTRSLSGSMLLHALWNAALFLPAI